MDLDPLLRLDGLMQTAGETPALHDPAGVEIDDADLPVPDDVIHVPPERTVSGDSLLDSVVDADVFGVKEVFHTVIPFGLGNTLRRQNSIFPPFVNDIVAFHRVDIRVFVQRRKNSALEITRKGVRDFIIPDVPTTPAGEDHRRHSLVQQNAVRLVHDCEIQLPQNPVPGADGNAVAKIVEAQLGRGGIGDVRPVGRLLFLRVHAGKGQAHAQAEGLKHRTVRLIIPAGKVFVHSDHVDAPPVKRHAAGRKHGRK